MIIALSNLIVSPETGMLIERVSAKYKKTGAHEIYTSGSATKRTGVSYYSDPTFSGLRLSELRAIDWKLVCVERVGPVRSE